MARWLFYVVFFYFNSAHCKKALYNLPLFTHIHTPIHTMEPMQFSVLMNTMTEWAADFIANLIRR